MEDIEGSNAHLEFNQTRLASLILSGYKFILYVPFDTHGLLYPFKEVVPESLVTKMNGYQIGITEREVQSMADGEFEFDFFVVEPPVGLH